MRMWRIGIESHKSDTAMRPMIAPNETSPPAGTTISVPLVSTPTASLIGRVGSGMPSSKLRAIQGTNHRRSPH